MSERRWTILIVPEGSEAPRTYELSERRLRLVRRGAVAAVLAVVALGMVAGRALPSVSRFHMDGGAGAPAISSAAAEDPALRASLEALRDTIEVLGRRDQQLRLAAGLPTDDSAAWADPVRGATGRPAPEVAGPPADIDSLIRRANLLSAGFNEVRSAIARNADKLAATPSIMPTGGWLTSQFTRSRFHPILHVARPHEGIDVSAPMGSPVVAPAAGVVERVTQQTGYGLVLEIDHGNGIETKYAHLSRVAVRPGQKVTRGQTIAAVGNSGLSTGPHLHYEIHVHGKVVDPLTYVLPGAIPD
jgi:murein DD-endopeptidase MepM/ murein hydrolase activator NlpD